MTSRKARSSIDKPTEQKEPLRIKKITKTKKTCNTNSKKGERTTSRLWAMEKREVMCGNNKATQNYARRNKNITNNNGRHKKVLKSTNEKMRKQRNSEKGRNKGKR